MDDNYNQEQKAKESIPNEVSEAPITPNTQTETTNEPAKPQPVKKSKNGLIASLIIIIILLIGALVAVLIISNNNNGNNNGNNNAVVEDTEVSISEGVESKTMNDNLRIIFGQKNSVAGTPITAEASMLDYSKEIVSGTFTSKNQKLDAVLRYLWTNDEFKPVNKADYKDSENLSAYYGQYTTRAEFFKYTTVISADTVAKLYYKVFGEEPEHQTADKLCGGFLYDSTRKVYYNGPLNACGGYPTTGYFFKNVGYSKKGGIYYADYKISYHVVEAKSSKNDNVDDTGISRYYGGRDKTSDIIKSFEKSMEYSVDEKSKLTDSDWEKVKTYRFTFVKNGDNFNYTGIIEK